MTDINRLVEGYIRLREKKAELEAKSKQELAPIKKLMSDIENRMLKHMQETGAESIKTGGGTAYKTVRSSASVADRSAFLDFVVEQQAWEFLESRANKSAVQAFREETGELPPGLNWREELAVNFRQS